VALRIATELIFELRFLLQSLGVALDGPAVMLGDNMLLFSYISVISIELKKSIMQLHAIAYKKQ
jgi:hypothetical protein